jgi:exosome complex component RRP42
VREMNRMSESYITKLVGDEQRVDGRKFDQFREIKIETDFIKTAEGSARIKIGKTDVVVGIKLSVGEPYPDSPDEGVLAVNTELSPIASPEFEPGPPGEESIEISRVIDRGIRESKCVDLEKLCIEAGKKVWMINVDVHVLDHDGNIIDAGGLAAIAALLKTKIPILEDDVIKYGEYEKKLEVKDTPIPITTAKIAGKFLIDPNLEEEQAMDARITLTSTKDGNICSIQKGGIGYLTKEEIEKATDLSIAKGKELRKLLGM